MRSLGVTKDTHTHTHTQVYYRLSPLNKKGAGSHRWDRVVQKGPAKVSRLKVMKLKVMDGVSWTGIPGDLGTFAETRKTIKIFGDTRTK